MAALRWRQVRRVRPQAASSFEDYLNGVTPAAPSRRRGFTLIEILIVVVIMSILAAVVVAALLPSVKDAKVSTARTNLWSLRDQIVRYKWEHNEQVPDGSADLKQLVSSTDRSGASGSTGPAFPFGPYMPRMPVNPFTDSFKVRLDSGAAGTAPAASGGTDAGWIYRPSTGEIWVDNADMIADE